MYEDGANKSTYNLRQIMKFNSVEELLEAIEKEVERRKKRGNDIHEKNSSGNI